MVRPAFRSIQVLRAIAALLVVAHHTTIMIWERLHIGYPNWVNGGSGVDLFFVISGFVMTISSAPLRTAPHPGRTFLARRLERVVPMYWLVTTVKVAVLLLLPALAVNALGSVRHVVASYLFFPTLSPRSTLEPVVFVGWTLNFEMAFYALFALVLSLRLKPAFALFPVLLLGAFGQHIPGLPQPVWLQFFESTMLLEFLFGVLLGLASPFVQRLPALWGLLLASVGFLPLLFWLQPNSSPWRGLLWGLPALAVVAGGLSMEARWGRRSPRWLLELGDASYSVYLVHTFALPAVGLLLTWAWHGWEGPFRFSYGFFFAHVTAALLSTVAGLLAYWLVEMPMTRWFKRRRRTAVPIVG